MLGVCPRFFTVERDTSFFFALYFWEIVLHDLPNSFSMNFLIVQETVLIVFLLFFDL